MESVPTHPAKQGTEGVCRHIYGVVLPACTGHGLKHFNHCSVSSGYNNGDGNFPDSSAFGKTDQQ